VKCLFLFFADKQCSISENVIAWKLSSASITLLLEGGGLLVRQ